MEQYRYTIYIQPVNCGEYVFLKKIPCRFKPWDLGDFSVLFVSWFVSAVSGLL